MRKEMKDDNISSVLAGMPAPGGCSGPVKLGAVRARDRALRDEAPSTT
jgi:hypothetical protein